MTHRMGEAGAQDAAAPGRESPDTCFVDVAVCVPVGTAFTYRVEAPAPEPGTLVEVPFGARRELGAVWGLTAPERAEALDGAKIKDVLRVLPAPPLAPALRAFVDWVAAYVCVPPGLVLRMILRSRSALEAPPTEKWLLGAPRDAWPERLTPPRARVQAVAADGLARPPAAFAVEAGVSSAVVRGLEKAGALVPLMRPVDRAPPRPDPDLPGKSLGPEQRDAAARLAEAIRGGETKPFLLDGITGSGKTEVYLEAVAEAVRAGRQILVLLPEIALTTQLLSRFETRFGCRPLEWHSDVSSKARRSTWRAVADGTASVVIGARSALFLPFKNLGLIIVDEEHDQSFKQDDGLLYHARDMALVRASLEKLPIILASATPSLESDVNAKSGRFERLVLPKRHGAAREPRVEAVDMRKAPPPKGAWLSPVLRAAIAETLERGEQSLLFLNRRGYAPLTLCRDCGHRMMSPHASTWLVEHRFTGRLVCHQTGFSMPKPKLCPACGAEDSLTPCGPGVERIAEEVASLFPEARTEIASSDMLYSPAAVDAFFETMAKGEIDILIGTQIVAKGHNFPNLTLVGVVDADLGLGGGDLRAAERTFQLLHQVGGRAGRAERPGRVMLQTHMPEAPVLQALCSAGRDAFLEAEAAEREAAGLPPFGRFAAVILSGPSEQAVLEAGRNLVQAAPATDRVVILGPVTAPIAVVRGRHRARLLIKADKAFNLPAYMARWLNGAKTPSNIRAAIDIDPYNFL